MGLKPILSHNVLFEKRNQKYFRADFSGDFCLLAINFRLGFSLICFKGKGRRGAGMRYYLHSIFSFKFYTD